MPSIPEIFSAPRFEQTGLAPVPWVIALSDTSKSCMLAFVFAGDMDPTKIDAIPPIQIAPTP
jgi:hypothetical protein